MKQLYPPQAKKEKEIGLILAVMDSFFYERKAIYFSVPITTGKNFSHWHAAFGRKYCTSDSKYMKEHRMHVIEPNRTKVREIASEFSRKFRRPLINPMRLQDLPEWTQ